MGLCWFFKQKTAYEMRISDWSSDVCSSDLRAQAQGDEVAAEVLAVEARPALLVAVVRHQREVAVQQILQLERQVDTVVDAVVVVEIVVVVGQVDAQQQVAPQFPLHFEAGGGMRLRRGARRAGRELAPRGPASHGGAPRHNTDR